LWWRDTLLLLNALLDLLHLVVGFDVEFDLLSGECSDPTAFMLVGVY
jgi:hypothetical protein